jgi:hypothetical protein
VWPKSRAEPGIEDIPVLLEAVIPWESGWDQVRQPANEILVILVVTLPDHVGIVAERRLQGFFGGVGVPDRNPMAPP